MRPFQGPNPLPPLQKPDAGPTELCQQADLWICYVETFYDDVLLIYENIASDLEQVKGQGQKKLDAPDIAA